MTSEGFTGVDLTGLNAIQDVRRRMDSMILELSILISTLEVDTEIFMNKESARSSIFVSNDAIVTDYRGTSLITGDSLTLVGQTVLGDSLETLPAMAEAIYRVQVRVITMVCLLFLCPSRIKWNY
jgi:hypothetical protein